MAGGEYDSKGNLITIADGLQALASLKEVKVCVFIAVVLCWVVSCCVVLYTAFTSHLSLERYVE